MKKLLKNLYDLWDAIKQHKLFFVTTLIMITCMFMGYLIFALEIHSKDANITNFWDGFYWAIVTFTTTGYGDMTPRTPAGKMITSVFMISSTVLLTVVTGLIASFLVEQTIKEGRGLTTITGKGHIVICGWNDFAYEILKRLEMDEKNRHTSNVVLVNQFDEGFFHNVNAQFPKLHLFHVKGDFTLEGALKRANIGESGPVIVMADRSGEFSYDRADERTILGALTIKSMNSTAHITAELLNKNNVEHARRAGIQEAILRGSHSGALLASAAVSPGVVRVLNMLLSTEGPQIMKIDIPRQYMGKPVEEFADFLRESSTLLISIVSEAGGIALDDILSDDMSAIDQFIKRKFEESQKKFSSTKTIINPPPDYIVGECDYAIVLTSGRE